MTDEARTILSAALNLPEPERFLVLDGLLESLQAPGLWDIDDPKFCDELERRSQDPAPGISWDDVRRKIERQGQ